MDHQFYCTPCEKNFSGWIPLEEHNSSPAHKKVVENKRHIQDLEQSLISLPPVEENGHESLDKFMKTEDQNIFYCSLCQSTCSGKIPALSHVRGKSHRKKVQQQKFSQEGSLSPSSFSSPVGSVHVGKMPQNESPELRIFQTNPLTGHLYCPICKLSVSGEVPAWQHVNGKAHIKKARIAMLMQDDDDLVASFGNLSVSPTQSANDGAASPALKPKIPGSTGFSSPLINLHQDVNNQERHAGQDNNGQREGDDVTYSERKAGHDFTELRSLDDVEQGSPIAPMEQESEDSASKHRDLIIDPKTGQWKCKVCGVALNSEQTVNQHFSGKAHLKKAAARVGVPEVNEVQVRGHDFSDDVETVSMGQYRCKVCSVSMTGMPPLEQHLEGKSHLKKKKLATIRSQLEQHSVGNIPFDGQPLDIPPIGQRGMDEKTPVNAESHDPNSANMNLATAEAEKKSPDSSNKSADLDKYWGTEFTYVPPTAKHTVVPHAPVATNAAVVTPAVGPPPGFSPLGNVPQSHPLGDFLNHQQMASESQPSHMHHFWSMQSNSLSHQDMGPSETYHNNASGQPRVAPIGTPAAQPQRPSFLNPGGGSGDWREFCSVDNKTNQLICRICNIPVSGEASAASHVKGEKHGKKLRVLQFEANHMGPKADGTQQGAASAPFQSSAESSASFEVLEFTPAQNHQSIWRTNGVEHSSLIDGLKDDGPHTLRGVSYSSYISSTQ